jgi:putative aminopeptidase FrvX
MSRADRESPSSRTPKGSSKARGKATKRASAQGAGKGTPKVLLDLLCARGPSGYETAPATVWREAAGKFAEVSTDVLGTPLARVAAKHGFEREARRLLVMGHIDEIGLIVTHIDDDGYLWFGPVGGWDAQILVGQRVTVSTRGGRVLGVVGKKPIHLLREEDRKKVAEVRDLHIDIGARDGDDARGRVRVGDVAVIDADPAELPNGRLTSRALDNRLGSFVALEAARLVAAAGGAEWELAAAAVAQEEITFGGSRTSAFALEPDAAIVVDVTHATDAPGIEIKEVGKHELGSGPVLSRGSTLHPQLFELLYETAEQEKIPCTVEATARATGTDADAVHVSRAGVPTALVSIPIRYMHSPVELVQLDDVHACARLIAAAALRLDTETLFTR